MKPIYLMLLLVIGITTIYILYKPREGYYSDYHRMVSLPWVALPHASGLLGGVQAKLIETKYPNKLLPRFGPYYDQISVLPINQGIAIYETGTAYNPNYNSEFGVITPDDI